MIEEVIESCTDDVIKLESVLISVLVMRPVELSITILDCRPDEELLLFFINSSLYLFIKFRGVF